MSAFLKVTELWAGPGANLHRWYGAGQLSNLEIPATHQAVFSSSGLFKKKKTIKKLFKPCMILQEIYVVFVPEEHLQPLEFE